MAECGIIGCHRRAIGGYDGLCQTHYVARHRGDLAGVGHEEVARRREQYAQRLAGCPLEQWVARRRKVSRVTNNNSGVVYTSCICACHDQAA